MAAPKDAVKQEAAFRGFIPNVMVIRRALDIKDEVTPSLVALLAAGDFKELYVLNLFPVCFLLCSVSSALAHRYRSRSLCAGMTTLGMCSSSYSFWTGSLRLTRRKCSAQPC